MSSFHKEGQERTGPVKGGGCSLGLFHGKEGDVVWEYPQLQRMSLHLGSKQPLQNHIILVFEINSTMCFSQENGKHAPRADSDLQCWRLPLLLKFIPQYAGYQLAAGSW